MTVGAVNPEALDRIIAVCERADLAAMIIGRGLMTYTRVDGELVLKESRFEYTRHYRARRVAQAWKRDVLHVLWALSSISMGMFFGRWA